MCIKSIFMLDVTNGFCILRLQDTNNNTNNPHFIGDYTMLKQVTKKAFVKLDELESGAKLILAYAANGAPLLKKGRFCFYDTKYHTIS